MSNQDTAAHNDTSASIRAPQGKPSTSPKAAGALHADLVIIRGLPGSGKSTMAMVLSQVGYTHVEADMFFVAEGVYRYDASRIREAHAWCQKVTRDALSNGERVVVSNTFTQLREIEPYRAMTKSLRIIEAAGMWKNCHGVPEGVLARMAERWEALAH